MKFFVRWFRLLKQRLEWEAKNVKVWRYCNIYLSAKLSENVSVGSYTEIGPGVVVGRDVRIGAKCFIPEGVVIESKAWIGPCVTFTNDRYPPSPREKWEQTFVKNGAVIGAGCTILPGVIIGKGAIIGAGTTVSRNVAAGEVVSGPKATRIRIVSRRTGNE